MSFIDFLRKFTQQKPSSRHKRDAISNYNRVNGGLLSPLISSIEKPVEIFNPLGDGQYNKIIKTTPGWTSASDISIVPSDYILGENESFYRPTVEDIQRSLDYMRMRGM